MVKHNGTLAELWKEVGFNSNPAQRDAILHTDGPLYLPAGPGSGKTRVLLWRTLNLLVYHDVKPEEIYLSTFTEKAALQLQEGLQALLGIVTNRTGRPFDLSRMYVGTVHSLCQRMLADRRFSQGRQHPRPPRLLDELEQYFFLYRMRAWRALLQTVGLDADNEGSKTVNAVFGGSYDSRHQAVQHCLAFFNRLSEECIEPGQARQASRQGMVTSRAIWPSASSTALASTCWCGSMRDTVIFWPAARPCVAPISPWSSRRPTWLSRTRRKTPASSSTSS